MRIVKTLAVVGLMLSNIFLLLFGYPAYTQDRMGDDNWMIYTKPVPNQEWPFDKPFLHLLIWRDSHYGNGLQIHTERERPKMHKDDHPGTQITWRLRIETFGK